MVRYCPLRRRIPVRVTRLAVKYPTDDTRKPLNALGKAIFFFPGETNPNLPLKVFLTFITVHSEEWPLADDQAFVSKRHPSNLVC